MNELKEITSKRKAVNALLSLYRARQRMYVQEVCKSIDTTYAHTVGVVGFLHEHGCVAFERDGRKKYVTLTRKGKFIAEKLSEIDTKLSDIPA